MKFFLIAACIIAAAVSCSHLQLSESQVEFVSDNSLYNYQEGDHRVSLKTVEGTYAPVVDTGSINIVKFYTYRDNRFYVLSYQTDKRYLKNRKRSWRMVTGTIIYRNSFTFTVDNISEDETMEKKLNQAVKDSLTLVQNMKKKLDLNKYKETLQFQRHMRDVAQFDFNTLPYKSDPVVVCLDNKKMIAGIQCGSYILRKKPVISDFLTLFVIYDLNKAAPLKLQVINTAYLTNY